MQTLEQPITLDKFSVQVLGGGVGDGCHFDYLF